MRKNLVCCFSFLLLLLLKTHAQVNLQTGGATFSLPIFNWQDDKSRLNGIVALSYGSGSGLRTNDVASNVGQGWSLVAGGVISRMQVGQPDDQVSYAGNNQDDDIRKYPPGILYPTVPVTQGAPLWVTKYPIYGHKNQVYAQHNKVAEDKELDYFTFQFNGKAGMFILDPNNLGVAHSLGDSKIKITFQQDAALQNPGNIRTKITSFIIQDEDGVKYKFAKHGLTKVLEWNYCDSKLNIKHTQPKFKPATVHHQAGFENSSFENPYIINSWYLTEVEDPFTQRKVQLTYEIRDINCRAGEDLSYNKEKDYTIISHKKSITKTPVIKTIVYPDGHTATINYGENRVDMNGDKVVSSIDITYHGRYLSRHELKTTYVMLSRYGTPVSDYQKKIARLYLKSVRKIGPDLQEDSPPYIFDYNLGSGVDDNVVPPAFHFAKDIWGFYNGYESKSYHTDIINKKNIEELTNGELRGLCFMREGTTALTLNAKPGFAKNGLLRQIIFPTGGTLSYEYSQNTGILNSATTNAAGVHVTATKSTDGGYTNNCSNPLVTYYSFINADISSSLWGLEMPVNRIQSETHYQPEKKYYKYSFPFGECDWRYKHPGIISQNQAVSLSDFQRIMENAAPYLTALNVLSTISDISTIISTSAVPPLVIIGVILDLASTVMSCIGDRAKDYTNTIYYNYDLNGVAPMPTQFKRVVVTEGSGSIGRTEHEFTSSDDYAIWVNANPTYASIQRFASWAYGLPKLTTVYGSDGNRVRETVNTYNFDKAKSLIGRYGSHPDYLAFLTGVQSHIRSLHYQVKKSYSERNTNWTDPLKYNDVANYKMASTSDLNVLFYGLYTGRTVLTNSKERVYKQGSNTDYAETSTAYSYASMYNYDPVHYEKTYESTTLSNGDLVYTDFTYSGDYSTGIFTTLQNNNVTNQPVQAYTRIAKAGGAGTFLLKESINEYTQLANGDVKLYRTLDQKINQPIPNNSIILYQGPGSNISNYDIGQQFIYGNNGLVIGAQDNAGRKFTNIYDYSDKYVVASVINADPVNDPSAYTSFETEGFGGWTMNGMVISYNSSNFVTGARSLNLGTNNLTRTLNTAKAYILSFWASNNSVSISGGASLVKSAPTINGFTYYEYTIPQGTSSVTVSGNSTIDELRLYPKTARMRTVSYDPIIGKTSECDENNRITYYSYDRLGRLLYVKDEQKNVVKMYEYNNVSAAKQNGCPGTYSNNMIREEFTKNNCGSGFIGSKVDFTIPANTYTSTISQEDADAKAEAFLLANGQTNANDNGTCTVLHYNDIKFQTFTTQGCPVGQIGGQVTYTVPANKYSSIISKADANEQALDEILANGEWHANGPGRVCVTNYNAQWEWLEGSSTYCSSVNGNLPPHLFVLMTDVNPNSSTYNQTQWVDVGPQDECPVGNYYNAAQSGNFTKNDCGFGYTGSTVTYTVPAGQYSSTVSQAAANQLAINNVNANGQSYANTNGTCSPSGNMVNLYYSNFTGGGILYVTMTNTSTFEQYFFEMNTYAYPNILFGSVSEGNYDIEIIDYNGWTYRYYEAGCFNYTSGMYMVNFYNIPINDFCSNFIIQ